MKEANRKVANGTERSAIATSAAFEKLQSELLANQSKVGQRAPGRARVERIIETAIELLADHNKADISIAMIASHAGMTRTSVYAHFSSIEEIFEQISVRFVQQTGIFVERYVRDRNPRSLAEVVTLTIDGIQEYFNRPDPDTPGALASHVPFQGRHAVKDYDRVSALTYHSLWHVDWPIEPLSQDDPFRLLIVLQSALFELSIQRDGKITDTIVKEAKEMALDVVRRAERRFGSSEGSREFDMIERVTTAASNIATSGNMRLLEAAVTHLENLARIDSNI